MSRIGRWAVGIVALGVVLAGFAWWQAIREITVRTAPVETDVEVRVFGIGAVEAQVFSKVGFQAAGKVVEVAADQGDVVKAGAILARLDSEAQRAKLMKSEAALRQAVYDNRWMRRDLRRLRLEQIGFIFQFHNLLPFLNAWENVAVARVLAGAPPAQARRRAEELLAYLEVDRRKDAMPAELSGGEAQRIAIARALANDPRIILADEPTAALDSQRAGIVIDLLKKVAAERQAAVIVVTHDQKIFDRFDRNFSLRDCALEGDMGRAA